MKIGIKAFAAGNMDTKILKELERRGFEIFLTKPLKTLLNGLWYHPDMQLAALDGVVVCEPSMLSFYEDFISSAGCIAVAGETRLECNYPRDVAYNVAVVSDFCFHNTKYTDGKIKSVFGAKTFLDVAQGYSGCSVCRAGEGALITADASIYKKSIGAGLDCLLISPGNILLDGFDYGFIGGASFYCGKTVYFFGKISLHPDYTAIKDFCEAHGTRICELSDGALSDYGSLITLD